MIIIVGKYQCVLRLQVKIKASLLIKQTDFWPKKPWVSYFIILSCHTKDISFCMQQGHGHKVSQRWNNVWWLQLIMYKDHMCIISKSFMQGVLTSNAILSINSMVVSQKKHVTYCWTLSFYIRTVASRNSQKWLHWKNHGSVRNLG